MESLSYFCLFVSLFVLVGVNCDCKLSLNKDLGDPMPVLLRNNEFLEPNTAKGDITIKRSENIVLACTGAGRHVVLGNVSAEIDVVEATCVDNTTFRVGHWVGNFKDITCNMHPWFTAEETKEKCHGANSRIIKLGYKVRDAFHTLYLVCFDRILLTSLYTKHYLTPQSRFFQIHLQRPQFVEGTFFGKVRMRQVYKIENQKKRFIQIFGEVGDKYIDKKQFLSRGHLAARADFSLGFAQRASFHYINAVPQWMRGNAGDWAALEEALRRRVQTYGPVTVYTGAHGVLALADSRGRMTDLYLADDENNNGVIPVPLYNYKLVYDERNKRATAFVSINTSYYNETLIEKFMFCEDICEDNSDFRWLTWRADGTTSFCCEYEQFRKKINDLPKLEVRGPFY